MIATPVEAFAAWNAFLGPVEGVLSLNPKDSGNWSDGKLVGTKFGIAASSHPGLDIAHLTLAQAIQIRKTEYWDAIHGDTMHPSIAFVLAEAAYGSGPVTARRQMQSALGVKPDGVFGALTFAAITQAVTAKSRVGLASGLDDLLTEFSAVRLLFEASLGTKWLDFEGGWTRRLFRGLLVARSLANGSTAIALPPVINIPVTVLPSVPSPPFGPITDDADTSADVLNAAELARIRAEA